MQRMPKNLFRHLAVQFLPAPPTCTCLPYHFHRRKHICLTSLLACSIDCRRLLLGTQRCGQRFRVRYVGILGLFLQSRFHETASGSSRHQVTRLWDAETGDLLRPPLEGHEDWISSVVLSPDGKRIASGSGDKTIRLWDAETGDLLQPPLEGHDGSVNSVAFSPDGKCLVSASDEQTIRMWNVDAEVGFPRHSVSFKISKPD